MTKNRKDLTPRRISRLATARPKSQQASANIKVVIRVRPPNSRETDENQRTVVKCNEPSVLTFDPEEESTPFFFHGVKQKRRDLLKKQHKNMQFNFDRVFAQDTSNQEVFNDSTKSLIDILMDGCNCSVFVYGATGAGKTYTMLGKPEEPGITVLTMQELFARKNELSNERNFELFVTYLEVYNENVRDLLKPSQQALQLREDSQFGVRVAGLTHKKIVNSDELFDLLEQGNKNRTQHPTDANAESSRSHAVFQVYLQMVVKQTGKTIMAKLSMIDLAGSERGAATGCKGLRFTEGANINKSLLALGNCINSLADGQRHVPYRNSKLTRILKDSLGGNCHTVMIANVSPSSLSFEDTYNTLKYANRAKKIKSNVKKNVVTGEKSAMEYIKIIEELNEKIRLLSEEVSQLKSLPTSQESDRDLTSEATNKTFTTVSSTNTGMEPITSEEHIDELRMVYQNYMQAEERRHLMAHKKCLLEMRIDLKDEANNRLSGFTTDSPERENGHRRMVQTMDRLRRQTKPFEFEIEEQEGIIMKAKTRIAQLTDEFPELVSIAEVEQLKIDKLRAVNDRELLDAMFKIQANELNARGELLEKLSEIVQPWYFLLKSRNIVTDDMTASFQNLKTHLLGYCSVKFEDGGDSGLSTTSSSTSNSNTEVMIVQQEQRSPNKRKLTDSSRIDSTFTTSQTARSKASSDNALFKEYQPSPAKRVAKAGCIRSSPRLLKKENKTVASKLRAPHVGTMGTSARFPASSSKAAKVQHTVKRPFR